MGERSIKAIDKTSVARICSGQVITDLATAVKELVENSIDAGAKHVEVKLKDFGLDMIEVSDNGCGVSPGNHEGLVLKYHTSKLSSFSDLARVTSFGFRGEALSSLCELTADFFVTTRTADQTVGVKLAYGRDGKLLNKSTAPRQVGTTVSIAKLFEPLPVRRGEFKRNIKKQFNKLLRAMQAYALISLGIRITVTNVKSKGGKQTLIGTQYNNKLGDNVTNVFGAKFLSTLVAVEVCINKDSGEDVMLDQESGSDGVVTDAAGNAQVPQVEGGTKRSIWGMVSKAGEGVGRSDNDRQFLYLNGRPVDLPKVLRAVNEVWRMYEMKHKPAIILDLKIPAGEFDVNVTPDKREIFLTDEGEVVDALKKKLHELWTPSRYTMPLNQGQLVQAKITSGSFSFLPAEASARQDPDISRDCQSSTHAPVLANGEAEVSKDSGSHSDKEGDTSAGRSNVGRTSATKTTQLEDGEFRSKPVRQSTPSLSYVISSRQGSVGTDPTEGDCKMGSKRGKGEGGNVGVGEMLVGGHTAGKGMHVKRKQQKTGVHAMVGRADFEPGEELNGEGGGGGLMTENSLDYRSHAAGDDSSIVCMTATESVEGAPQHVGGAKGDAEITDVSMGEYHQETGIGVDAEEVTYVGGLEGCAGSQGSRNSSDDVNRRSQKDDLSGTLSFHLDEVLAGCQRLSSLKRVRGARNACASSFSSQLSGKGSTDERDSNVAARAFSRVLNKEHFKEMRVVGQFNLGFMICQLGADLFILDQHACDEKYNFETLQKNTTIHQQPLVRPLPVEATAMEEMTIIDNLALFEKNGFCFEVDKDQPTTKKLKITAVPFSKSTQFGVEDVHELASIVSENAGKVIRLPKARAMFASRACRSSIMIGTALDNGQMARVVAKMAEIEQPWNCPHGRPTLRHLADVSKSLRAAFSADNVLDVL